MLNPAVGRWMEEDPIDFKAGDADKYRYVGNDATNATDPSGLQAQAIGSSAINAVFVLCKRRRSVPTLSESLRTTITKTVLEPSRNSALS